MNAQQSKPTVWSHPLPAGEDRERWIDCVLEMVEIEKRDGCGHIASHWVFCRKVLHEVKQDCIAIAARFQNTALTREACELLANDWWEPTVENAA